jgi:hypothetical protein
MAYYRVSFRGRWYINRSLVKTLYKVGDSGIASLVAEGKVSIGKLLDMTAYEVRDRDAGHLDVTWLTIEYQDLDAQFNRLKRVPTVGISKMANVVKLAGLHFMALQNVLDPDKYRWVRKQPCIKVFNKKYVALDAIIS